ncbi:MAG: DNA translocase FtsK [Spirochaetaceae bacterium]|nr:MAG: DNA translocase FtsK [Spirochaetaceae bacterium]
MSKPKPTEQSINLVLGSLVLSVGAVLLFSFVLHLGMGSDAGFLSYLVTLPGRFLFLSFHYAGLFVPLYLSTAGGLLLLNRLRMKTVLSLHLALLPFFSSALGLRLLLDSNAHASAAPRMVAEALTPLGGAITSLLATVVLLVVLVRFMRAPLLENRGLKAATPPSTDELTDDLAEFSTEFSTEVSTEVSTEDLAEEPNNLDDFVPEDVWNAALDVDDGHQPLQVSGTLLGPRIAELLRNQVTPLTSTSSADEALDLNMTDVEDDIELEDELEDFIEDDSEGELEDELEDDIELEDELEDDTFDDIDRELEDEIYDEEDNEIEDEDEIEDEIEDELSQEVNESAVFVFRRRESEVGRSFSIVQDAMDEEPILDRTLESDAVADSIAEAGLAEAGPEPGIDELSEFAEPEMTETALSTTKLRKEKKSGPRAGRAAARAKRLPYNVPVDGLLDHYSDDGYWEIDDETRKAGELLRVTLEEFQIQAEVTGIRKGPVITMFELLPAPGVKLAKITNLADNIALRLAASSVRIVAPIPGKHAVGIEIPNKRRNIVSFGELLREENFTESDMAIPLAIGKDIPGDAQIIDLARTPHLLIAGATGSGKSVCVNSIICSVLYRRAPHEVKLILIDPKIVELKFYNDIPHLLTPVITDPKRAFQALQWCIYEMERRYSLLDSLGVRDIRSFNAKVKKREIATEKLPYIVVVVDEFADLMATSGKELESTLARLAAMSRAVGIHLVLATQRPSTDVITGLIKANIPSRIAFMVASKIDSRIIIDSVGAEKLLGKGDMLFTSAWDPFPFRIQGAFLSEDEVERVVEHVKTLGEPEYIDDEIFIEEDEDDVYHDELEDPLLEKAINIVVGANKASASYLQRRLKIGYNRAARLVEEMERLGIVGPQNGSKARDILHVPEQVG